MLILLLIVVAGIARAEQRTDQPYTRFLVPVLPVPGWDTELWIRNDGAESADVFPLVMDRVVHPVNCAPSATCFGSPIAAPGVAPRTTLTNTFAGIDLRRYSIPVWPSYAGAILHVAQATQHALRVRLTVHGTQVPVVSEAAFRATPISLPLKTAEGHRYALRVYCLDCEAADLIVRFYAEVGNGGETLEREIPLTLIRPNATAGCNIESCPWPRRNYAPGYAAFFFDTHDVFPWKYRVEIDAAQDLALWAMISETNNATRAVRIFSLD